MTRWITSSSDPAWAALFTSFTKSAFRLEGQQIYDSESEREDFAKFLAGEPIDPSFFEWARPKITAQIAAGRHQTTVRVVVEPQTDYTRFEMATYPEFVAMGEDIRVISVQAGEWPEGVPRHDYWLFDDRDVWRMHYREDCTFAGAELLEGEDVIAQHLQWRDTAIALSVPLHDYLASHPN
ncbi:DUF6879 family protein [Pseudonocardia sp. CA-107938]|uniref:DUF6879 family protein n=1 Tax=Pseudonocardia sp. CA-107938 TaxID=3240021 RepID=UPI003D8A75B1